MKSTRNFKYVGKYDRNCFFLLIFIKYTKSNKTKFIIYADIKYVKTITQKRVNEVKL